MARRIGAKHELPARIRLRDSQQQERAVPQRRSDGDSSSLLGGAETRFLRHFVLKMIFLPRQARDKHGKS